jgi:microcystin degradation protein MlrC
MAELLKRADRIEAKGEALVISVCAGFTAADIHDVGPTVTVTTDGETPQGRAIAEEFMDYAWKERAYRSIKLLPIAEVIARAKAGSPGRSRWSLPTTPTIRAAAATAIRRRS